MISPPPELLPACPATRRPAPSNLAAMSDPLRPGQALSFGSVADAYERGRPDYPAKAVEWLVGGHPRTVLELGAGTGKLTRMLVAAGHDVHATEPDEAMLDILRKQVPGARTSAGGAEEIALPDRSVDVVVSAQAFHWFDHERALPEIARVLRPGGRLALVWNVRDERIPWARRLGAIIGSPEDQIEVGAHLETSERFGEVEEATYPHWQDVDRDLLLDLVRSRSAISTLGEEERQAKLDAVAALYDDYGRGHDGMQLPYRARCFRAPVLEPPGSTWQYVAGAGDEKERTDADAGARSDPSSRVADGPDDSTLLFDFR